MGLGEIANHGKGEITTNHRRAAERNVRALCRFSVGATLLDPHFMHRDIPHCACGTALSDVDDDDDDDDDVLRLLGDRTRCPNPTASTSRIVSPPGSM